MFILLVDNNRFYISVLKEMLHKAGFNRIGNVDNGLECVLELFKGEIPDAIIIDESQCTVNNVDVIKNIRKFRSDLTVIILTSSVAPVNVNRIYEKEYTHFISKDSISADNLPKVLYDFFVEKQSYPKKSSVLKVFASFKRSFAGLMT